ncbi:MAG TPA: WD40 repeat domain-containing protein, partial [Chthonomonadaceae bacterium]|nr:WD40 repeat domain-containing protein [Chthonomonadaceae bacterium]
MKVRPILIALLVFLPALLCCGDAVARRQPAPKAGDAPAENGPELVLQVGHFGEIMAIAFSPDNRLVATASRDQTVKLWETKRGTLRYSLTGHAGRVFGVAFSPDGKTLYSVGQAGVVRAWDTESGTLLRTFPPFHTGGRLSTLWCGGKNGDTLLVAIAHADKSILLEKISLSTGKLEVIATLTEHERIVNALAFSPDGKTLASGDMGGSVKTWDTEDGSLQRNLSGHAMRIDSLAFSADSKTLADACFDGESFLYEVKSGKKIGEMNMNRPEEGVGAVAFSPDGSQIVTGGHGGEKGNEYLMVWDAKTYQETRVLQGHEGFVSALAYSPDGSLLASGSRDNTLRIWDAHTGKERSVSGRSNYLTSVAFSPDGSLLASGSDDRYVRIWNARTGALDHILSGHAGGVLAVAYSSNGALLASGGRDGKVLVWDAHTGALRHTLKSPGGAINALAFSPDGATLAGGCGWAIYGGSVQVWDINTEKLTHTLDGQSLQPVRTVAFTPDGSQIVSASEFRGGGEVRFWDAKTGAQLFKDFGHGFHALALSPDGKTLVTGGAILEA